MSSITPNRPVNPPLISAEKLDREADKREANIAKNFARGSELAQNSTSAQSQLAEATDGDTSEANAVAGQRSTGNDGTARREIFGEAANNFIDGKGNNAPPKDNQDSGDNQDDEALQQLRKSASNASSSVGKGERVGDIQGGSKQALGHEELMRASGALDKASLSTFAMSAVYPNLQSILDSNHWKQSPESDIQINKEQMYSKK